VIFDKGLLDGATLRWLAEQPIAKPLQPFADHDARSLIENCCMKEAKQPWELGHSPQQNARAVRVHIVFTRLVFALATAYRLEYEREARGGESVGWQR
jgi:hypothetical protein